MADKKRKSQAEAYREQQERERRERELKRKKIGFISCFSVIFAVAAGAVVYAEVGNLKSDQSPTIPVETSLTFAETTETETVEVPTETEISGVSAELAEGTETVPAETAPEETVTEPAPEETAAPETAAEAAAPEGHYNDSIYIPSWITQDFLPYSEYCRGGEALTQVNNIVIHYVGNEGSTAKENRDYFANLANPVCNPEGHGASSHFIVGLSGEVIQCIPVAEVAFANYPRNYDTISIETCHPDATGKFNDTTYASLVRLTAYILQQYNMNVNQIIRHHDVTGKMCPLYYVEHPEAWEQFKVDVQEYLNAHPDIANEMP